MGDCQDHDHLWSVGYVAQSKCSYMTKIHSFSPSSLMSNLYLCPLSRFSLQEVYKNSDICKKQKNPNNLDTIFTIKLAKILTFLYM